MAILHEAQGFSMDNHAGLELHHGSFTNIQKQSLSSGSKEGARFAFSLAMDKGS